MNNTKPTPSPTLPHAEPLSAPERRDDTAWEWPTRPVQARPFPATLFEHAFVEMLRGWRNYATAHYYACHSEIHKEAAIGAAWVSIGEGLLAFLNDERHARDGATLAKTIRSLLVPPVVHWVPRPLRTHVNLWEAEDLIDVSAMATEAGFDLPVLVTPALWKDLCAIPEPLENVTEPLGRLWDVLFVGRYALPFAFQPHKRAHASCLYSLTLPVGEAQEYQVKAQYGPDDDSDPVITLMQPSEYWP